METTQKIDAFLLLTHPSVETSSKGPSYISQLDMDNPVSRSFMALTINERKEQFHKIFNKMVATLEDQNFIIKNKSENTKVAVIIEPRKHEFSKGVIYNIMYMLGPGWNLHIFTSKESKEWYKDLFPNWEFLITEIGVPDLTLEMYSQLLLNSHFWNTIKEENILIFQTDTMMFNSNINDFLEYDFVGANFFNSLDQSIHNGGNNGGFSFRHKTAMLDCLKNVSAQKFFEYRSSNGKSNYICPLHEDVYYSTACEILNKNLCPVEKRKEFSIEDGREENYTKPIGCHRFAADENSHIMYNILQNSKMTQWLD